MRLNGWRTAQNRRTRGQMPGLDIVPAEWDVLLQRLKLTNEDALIEVTRRTKAGEQLRKWLFKGRYVKQYERKFCPEAVLQAAGVKVVCGEEMR